MGRLEEDIYIDVKIKEMAHHLSLELWNPLLTIYLYLLINLEQVFVLLQSRTPTVYMHPNRADSIDWTIS